MDNNFDTHRLVTNTDLIRRQLYVLHALMLRDVKTRFLGSAWGYVISLAWPLTHILLVILINISTGRLQPYGESIALWAATGALPFLTFSYMSRFVMMGIMMNRPLVIFPTVKLMDILIARAIVELLSAGAVVLLLALIFYSADIDCLPTRPIVALGGLGAALLLGLGVGFINAIIAAALPFWGIVFQLSTIALWAISGVFFLPDNLPQAYLQIFAYNPVAHVVAWFRSGYYDGYGSLYLDKPYAVWFGVICLFIGFLMERMVRGRILQG